MYNNELYIGAEYFMDGVGTNIQIAVYDADTLYSDLLTIRGIGPKLARDIIDKITEGTV